MVPIATMQPNTIRDSKSERISVMVFFFSLMSKIAPIRRFVNLRDPPRPAPPAQTHWAVLAFVHVDWMEARGWSLHCHLPIWASAKEATL